MNPGTHPSIDSVYHQPSTSQTTTQRVSNKPIDTIIGPHKTILDHTSVRNRLTRYKSPPKHLVSTKFLATLEILKGGWRSFKTKVKKSLKIGKQVRFHPEQQITWLPRPSPPLNSLEDPMEEEVPGIPPSPELLPSRASSPSPSVLGEELQRIAAAVGQEVLEREEQQNQMMERIRRIRRRREMITRSDISHSQQEDQEIPTQEEILAVILREVPRMEDQVEGLHQIRGMRDIIVAGWEIISVVDNQSHRDHLLQEILSEAMLPHPS